MYAYTKLFAVLSTFEARITEARNSEKGITAIEYALMAAGIALIIAAALVTLRTKITGLFTGI